MRCNPSRWLWGLIPIAMLAWGTFNREQPQVEADLTERAMAALREAGQPWAAVTLTGRDAVITGRASRDGEPKAALDAVRSVWGIRTVQLKTDLAGVAQLPASIGPQSAAPGSDDAALKAQQDDAEAAAAQKAKQEADMEAEARADAEAQRAKEEAAATEKARAEEQAAALKAQQDAEAAAAQKAKQEADMEAEARADAEAQRAKEEAAATEKARAEEQAAALKAQQDAEAAAAQKAKQEADMAAEAKADAEAQRAKVEAAAAEKAREEERAAALKAQQEAEAAAAQKAKEEAEAAAAAEQKAKEEARAEELKAQQEAEAAAQKAKEAAEAAALKAKRKTTPETSACEKRLTEAAAKGVIHFDRASADIDPKSSLTIAKLAEIIKRCPGARVEVEGHTDAEGEPDRNQRLSERRARAVVRSLVHAGVAADRLTSVGHGAGSPVAPNDTRAGMAKNRRIEFRVYTD